MLLYCWATVGDAGPTIQQHWCQRILFSGLFHLTLSSKWTTYHNFNKISSVKMAQSSKVRALWAFILDITIIYTFVFYEKCASVWKKYNNVIIKCACFLFWPTMLPNIFVVFGHNLNFDIMKNGLYFKISEGCRKMLYILINTFTYTPSRTWNPERNGSHRVVFYL